MKLGEEEMELVKKFILLPMLLDVFERDKKKIQQILKTPGPYVKAIERAADKVHKDLADTRRAMRTTGLKVYDQESTKVAYECKTLWRGYHETHSYVWEILKTEAEIWMGRYLE